MAQFSSLQQSTEMTKHLEKLSEMTNSNQTYFMLGKEVTYINPYSDDPKPITGIAEAVTFNANNETTLIVDGKPVNTLDVIQVNVVSDDIDKDN